MQLYSCWQKSKGLKFIVGDTNLALLWARLHIILSLLGIFTKYALWSSTQKAGLITLQFYLITSIDDSPVKCIDINSNACFLLCLVIFNLQAVVDEWASSLFRVLNSLSCFHWRMLILPCMNDFLLVMCIYDVIFLSRVTSGLEISWTLTPWLS